MTQQITVKAVIDAPVQKVWEFYTQPKHITQWNNASEDWHTPHAENDLRAGGKFLSRMESKDGKEGFDFAGIYDEILTNSLIKYTMGDGRKVTVTMDEEGNQTKIEVSFDPENENSRELQQAGWQSILDNFKKYVEKN